LCAEHFRAAEVSPGDLRWAAHGHRPELLLLNPPRAGLRDSIGPLLGLEAKHVLLSCCSAESIVRDVARFVARGYAVERVWLCDMFPHTDHLELAVHLQRVLSVA
jgi:tRNA/tmRNA/rRNA uracil-C5-methylase (TrmA/RlmC/RlmD family)